MSGAFGDLDYRMNEAAKVVRQWVSEREGLSPETRDKCLEAASVLEVASDYQRAIDCLLCHDFSDETFTKFLEKPSARLRNFK